MAKKVYFEGMTTLEEVREAMVGYVGTIKPDAAEFKAMHKAYVTAYNKLRAAHKTMAGKPYERLATLDADQFEYMLTKVLEYNLDFEVRGTYLWVTGDTKPNRSRLTGLGFRYMWNCQKWLWKEGFKLPQNVDDIPVDVEKEDQPEDAVADTAEPKEKKTAKRGKKTAEKKTVKKDRAVKDNPDDTLVRKVEGKEHDEIMRQFKERAAAKRRTKKNGVA